jgi:hypothetical protein
MKHLSVVGKGYHTEEKVVGSYKIGNRIKFWGKRGAFWVVSGACLWRTVHMAGLADQAAATIYRLKPMPPRG